MLNDPHKELNRPVEDVKVHQAADRFPMMSDAELDELAADIKTNGQLHRVVYFNGQLLDGRNRIAACKRAGVEVKSMTLAKCDSPTNYVISANLKRRQLTPVQRAALAVDPVILDGYKAEAKARQEAAGARGVEGGRGNKKNPPSGSSTKGSSGNPRISRAVAAAAQALDVGRDSAQAMQKIRDEAPDVYEAAKRGEFKTVAEAQREAGHTPRHVERAVATQPQPEPASKDPRLVARAQRDEQILALHAQGIGAGEIAKSLGCEVSTVHGAKRRLGLSARDNNPLRGLTDYAIEFCDTWDIALAADGSQWANAAPEHVAELKTRLELLKQKTSTLIRRLNKEAKGDSE